MNTTTILYRVTAHDTRAVYYDMRNIHRTLDTEREAKSLIATLLKTGRYTQISVKRIYEDTEEQAK